MTVIRPVSVDTSDLLIDTYNSNLNATIASASGTITVYDITRFAINQILLIGELGDAGSEIILTHSATEPTGNTITLASNTTKAHPKDTPVYILLFNQVEISNATTLTGSKSVLSTTAIDPTRLETLYTDSAGSTGYYFTRYKNSITSVYSEYSDAIPVGGLEANTIGAVFGEAMDELHADYSDLLTFEMMLGWSNEFLSLVRGKMKKWSNIQEFDYVAGTVSGGVRRFVMPTTIYDANSNKSVNNVRVGNAYPLNYIDHAEYLQATEGISYTEVATQATAGQTSLVLDDTSDLDSTGSIDVFVFGTKYSIEYTANTKATNTLTVDSDQITVTLPVDSQVWQNIDEGSTEYYAIWDGYIYLWPIIDSTYEGENFYMDFYTDIVRVDSEGDVIYSPRYDALKHYLKWKIRATLEAGGKEDLKDPSYQMFKEIISDAIRLEDSGQNLGFVPRGVAPFGGRSKNKR